MTGESKAATPSTKRTASEGAQGSGAFLKAEALGSRGREFEIADTSWEPNYDKSALIPCLHLTAEGVNEGEEVLFKVTTIGNNKVLVDNGFGGEDISGLAGHKLFLSVSMVTPKSGGPAKASIRIAEFDGKAVPVS